MVHTVLQILFIYNNDVNIFENKLAKAGKLFTLLYIKIYGYIIFVIIYRINSLKSTQEIENNALCNTLYIKYIFEHDRWKNNWAIDDPF